MTNDTAAVLPAPTRSVNDPPSTRGPAQDPRWTRPALYGLLVVTAVTYLWNLGASGYANSYYAAAVQAGTQSWTAWLFGSLDAGNAITVDKPPAALWVMALSGRIFGFSSWSMLVPQALMGVASVALLYAAVRRWSGPRVGLAAAAVLAFTPAAVLIFRFNNPDALLVLLMVAAGYTTVRAVDAAATRVGTRWLVLTGVLVGFGFLAKMLQVMLVVPALAGVYLLVAPVSVRRRIGQLLAAGLAMVVSAGWYVALVELWPASSRPYIGGSTGNSLLELALGYNGLSRIIGGGGAGAGGSRAPGGDQGGDGNVGGVGGGGGFSGFGGEVGITRMFNADFGGNISWLLPAALLVLVAGLWLTRRAPRTDRARAGLVLWGGWLLVHGAVFSYMSGVLHSYYVVAMAPGLAGVLVVGTGLLWARRSRWAARVVLVAAVVGTAAWSAVLLGRTAEFLPWLRWVVLGAAVVAGVALLVPYRRWARVSAAVALAAVVAGVGGATGYAAETALSAHQGSIISAGPVPGFGPGRGGPGSAGDDAALTELLRGAGTLWSAATVGAHGAAGMELASGTSVIAIGGFTGGDQAPTLEQFQTWVADGKIRYFVGSDRGGPGGPGGARDGVGEQITSWVESHFAATTVGDQTVYDLTGPSR